MKYTKVVMVIMLAIFGTGCAITSGGFSEQTHFDFPNSNVKPLGQVKASIEKSSWIVPPEVTLNDVRNIIDQALKLKAGADMIINYRLNTTNTSYLYYYTMLITLEGTAVSMEVGEQELQELIDQSGY